MFICLSAIITSEHKGIGLITLLKMKYKNINHYCHVILCIHKSLAVKVNDDEFHVIGNIVDIVRDVINVID